MGGDHAPGVVIEGALLGVRELGVSVTLVGPEDRVRPLAAEAAGGETALGKLPIDFVDAPQVVEMDDEPLSVKRKKGNSIWAGLQLVKEGEAEAFVSAGNTGAVMAGATLVVRRLRGVERAALAALLPNRNGTFSVLLDVGANVEVKKSSYYEQFAVMGSCFSRAFLGVDEPRVALLSIGEEDIKGDDLIRRVHQDLKAGPVRFIGNIDGKAVYSGEADVIVTDGFTGNAILKASESLLVNLASLAREAVEAAPFTAKLGVLLLKPVLRSLRSLLDHDEYGAVPLLGVGAPVFIGHGSSSARSICSGLRMAETFVRANLNETIQAQLRELAEVAATDHAETLAAAGKVEAGGSKP
jgi:glycerol-3-phosphate acyltransferase PlsX